MTRHRRTRHRTSLHESSPEARLSRPLVAIVGRPNVGKSTLFNRLLGQRVAIVHDEPGVTRDRHYADATLGGREMTLVDTGGFDPESEDPISRGIVRQVEIALSEADVILCVLDGVAGLTTGDQQAVELLRRTAKPVLFVTNKADSQKLEDTATDFYRLGIPRLFAISALHGRGMHELEAALLEALPSDGLRTEDLEVMESEEPEPEEESGVGEEVSRPEVEQGPLAPIRVAFIGRPNAGKSSIVNRLAGEERMIVDDRPGTTIDAIDTWIERNDRTFVLVDTAGIRRKAKVNQTESVVEAVSVLHAIRAIERADIVVLMCDAAEGVAEQDAKILGLAVDRGRGVILGLNKSDLCSAKELAQAEEKAREKLAFAPFAPLLTFSTKTGRGVNALLAKLVEVHANYSLRARTGPLNRFFEEVLATHPPPTHGGRAPRLYYITQAATRPPTFIVMTNKPEAIHFSYRRFVQNQLRKKFGFEGVPLRLHFKPRRKRDDVR